MKLKGILMFVVLLCWTVSAYALDPTLTVGSTSYQAGKTVSVPITLTTNGANIAILAFELTYDPALLSAPQVTPGSGVTVLGKSTYDNKDATTGNTMSLVSNVPTATPGKYRVLIAGLVDTVAGTMTGGSTLLTDGIVATVTFTAASTSTGAITLTNSFTDAADASANTVAINGSAPVSLPFSVGKVGDCNSDGRISLGDISYAINAVLKKPGFTVFNPLCDVNMVNGVVTPDGKTTLSDISILINVVLKKPGYVLP